MVRIAMARARAWRGPAKPWQWIALGTAVIVAAAAVIVAVAWTSDGDSGLDCLDHTVLPCVPQSAELAIPVAGTDLVITYSSDRHRLAADGDDLEEWFESVGFGGWTPDVVHHLDVDAGIIHRGSGTSRTVEPIELTGMHRGRLAVADDDGTVHLFNDEGTHVQTVDGLDGRTVRSMRYDDGGRLVELIDSDAADLSFSHGDGQVTIEAPRGRTATLETNRAGHLVALTDVVGAGWAVEVDTDGLVTRFSLPDGGSYEFTYDSDRRLITERDPLGVITRWQRRAADDGYRLVHTASSGARTTWAIQGSDADFTATMTGPDGLTTRETGTRDRHTVTWPDGTGYDIRLAPDPRWSWQRPVVREAKVDLAGPSLIVSSTVEISGGDGDPFAVGSISETWHLGGETYTQVWDRAERELTVTSPEGREERVRLDGEGRAVSRAVGGTEQRLTYGGQGELTALQWNDGPQIRLEYDAEGVSMSGPEGVSHHLAVDAAGRITGSQVSPSEDVQITRLDSGAVSAVTPEGGGGEGELTYASDGRVESFALAGRTIRTWKYDAHGRAAGMLDGAGREAVVSYDTQSRPVRVETDADAVELRWNESTGQLEALDSEAVQLTHGYQGSALVTESWAGAVDGTVERKLDDRLRVSEIAVDDTRLPVSHDADGLVSAIGDARIGRDADSGEINRIAHGNLVEEREYDGLGQLSSVTVQAAGQPVYLLTVTRDDLGRVVTRREQVGEAEPRTSAMTYDEDGQLTQVTVDGGVTERYRYDELGNRIRVESADRLPELERDGAGRIVTEGSATFEYDDAGYLIARTDTEGTIQLTYDAHGLLREVRREGGPTVRYEHDARGRRVAATTDGEPTTGLLYLDAQRPAAMVGEAGVDGVFGYVDGSITPVTMAKDDQQYRIIADDTGSPRLVVDASTGEVAQRIGYEAFGRMVEDTAPGFQPFAFGGGILDPVSGLVRFGHRDYDPSSGRWTAPDPILYEGGDTNLYRYAHNDPVNLSDPHGLNSHLVLFWDVPPYTGGRTQGVLDINGRLYGISSGRAGPAANIPLGTPGFDAYTRGHVEGHAAATIRQQGASGGRLLINQVPCPSCARNLKYMLPEGSVLEVFGPDGFRQPYRGWPDGARTGRRLFSVHPGLWFAIEYGSWVGDMAEDAGDRINSLGEDLPDGKESQVGERFVCGPPWQVVTAETSALCDLPPPDDWSSIHGDPHIETIDGLRIDLQAAGEFVYVDNPNIEVQVRFEGNVGRVTYLTAVAVRSGEHVVEVIYEDVQAESVGDAVSVRIDGDSRLVEDSVVVPGITVIPLRDGDAEKVYIGTDDGWLIVVENLHISQNIGVAPPESPGETMGLLGSPNGDRLDDLQRRDGSRLALDTLETVAGLYGTYAAAWRVRPAERLFTDTPASKWLTDEMTAVPDDVVLSLGDLPPEDVRAARAVCVEAGVPAGPELEDCTYDVAISGEEQWADQHSQSNATQRFDTGDGEERKPDDPLFIAAHNCRLDELRALLSGGADVSIRREKDGWTALLFASQHDCPDIVSALLDAGADPATPNDKGFFPLYLAAQNGRTAVVRRLLDGGAEPERALPSGDTPLLIATFNGHLEVVTLLLAAGTDSNIAREDGVTPLLAAAQDGQLAIVNALIAAGGDVNRSTFDSLATPLHQAADGDLDVLSALIKAGADVNRQDARGNTALHYAASDGLADNVRHLVASGADPDIENERGSAPRDVADDSVAHLFR